MIMFEFRDIWFNPRLIEAIRFEEEKKELSLWQPSSEEPTIYEQVTKEEFHELIYDKIGNCC